MEPSDYFGDNGVLFIGEKGALSCPGWGGRGVLFPETRDIEYQRPAPSLPRSKGHHRDWLDACKGASPASANFEYGAALTEVGLLGLVAMRAGQKILWDARAMKCANAPQADRFLKGSYRSGWEIPS
jgi:hypothetical protein